MGPEKVIQIYPRGFMTSSGEISIAVRLPGDRLTLYIDVDADHIEGVVRDNTTGTTKHLTSPSED